MGKDRNLEVSTDGEEVAIRIGVSTMAKVIKSLHAPIDGVPVVDETEFVHSMVSALIEEHEDGETLVHRMLDAASDWCIEQGMDGFDHGEGDYT